LRILVTGAAGFLGSHLVERLLIKGYTVIGIDNLYTGSEENLKVAKKNKDFEFINHDVTSPFNVDVDGIFNLACPASPIHYQKNPVETIRTSFLGALNCLEVAKNSGAKVLQASTSEVYGDPQQSPQKETYWGNVNPIGIRSCYDEGKRAAETLFFDFHREYGTEIKVARIFNTYGPRMAFNDGRVVSNFIYQALIGQPISIYGTGDQTRSFCYVDDLITGLIDLFESDSEFTGPVNLGKDDELSIKALAELVQEKIPDTTIDYYDLPSDDPYRRKPDLEVAKRLLNWNPQVELSEGMDLIIRDFKERLRSRK
jgi:UDP-glucuronate decarboxylase